MPQSLRLDVNCNCSKYRSNDGILLSIDEQYIPPAYFFVQKYRNLQVSAVTQYIAASDCQSRSEEGRKIVCLVRSPYCTKCHMMRQMIAIAVLIVVRYNRFR
jgi:hypothetical protein